jgi:tetratricopeptide (TPR) repeat protein
MMRSYSPNAHIKVDLTSTFKVIFTLIFMCFSAHASSQSPEIQQAFRLIDIEQPSKGVSTLEKIVNNSTDQYYLGLAYLRAGNRDKALAAFEKGISMDDKIALNHVGKGHVRLTEKRVTEAKGLFEKALTITKQKDVDVLKAIGEAYVSDSKFIIDAINFLNKAKSINKNDPEVHILLGDAYLMQNNGGESVSSYERAASIDAKNAKANFKVAKVYERSNNNEMVKEYLIKAVTIDPEYAPAWKELAEVYYVEKQPDKAVEASDKYVALTEKKEEAKFFRAFVLVMAKRFDEANAIFQSVINTPTAPAVAFKFYAYSLIEQAKMKDDTTRATAAKIKDVFDKYFTKVKQEDITQTDYGSYGTILSKLKQYESAIRNFDLSLKLDPTQSDILLQKGSAEFKVRKYAESITTYRGAMNLRNNQLPSMDQYYLGMAYFLTDQYMEADTAFTKLSEMQPAAVYGHLWTAKSRANIDSTGAQGLAVAPYNKFIEIATQNADKNKSKNKKDLIEAYYYLGGYELKIKKNVVAAKKYFEKVLELDPKNAEIREFMDILKEQG